MKVFKLLILSASMFLSYSASSQIQFSGEAVLQGNYSTETELPFWMYKNTRGRIAETTNIAGWLSGRALYEIGESKTIELGGTLLYRDGEEDDLFLDELYLHFETPELYVTAGIKQPEEYYRGLSATNESMIWSLNARAMPGIQIGTNGPLFLNRYEETGFGVEGSWNEYLMEEDRYMSYARVHHKNLFLVYHTDNDIKIKAGLRHVAQWGGTPPEGETNPESVKDYVKVISLQGGTLANDIGSYEFHITKGFRDFEVEFIYNHMFESFSGARFSNAPDGRYGIFINAREEDNFVNSFMYEFYYTQNQHYTGNGNDDFEDYFNSGTYRSGWTYENRVIGLPLFTGNSRNRGVTNNRFTAHHIGIGGQLFNYFVSYPYKLLLTYSKNEGGYSDPFYKVNKALHVYNEYGVYSGFLDVKLLLGAEFNSLDAPVFGAGLQLRKSF